MTRAGQNLIKTISLDFKADYTEMIIFINKMLTTDESTVNIQCVVVVGCY